jgi:hypothetical protein
MKGILKLITACSLLLLIVSCSDDEPKVNPIVGEWKIDTYILTNLPEAYKSNEGYEFSSLWGESSYILSFIDETNYTRVLATSSEEISEEGEWSLNDDELSLDPDGAGLNLFNDFTVLTSKTGDLVLSTEVTFGLIPDIYFDTVTQKYRDYLMTLTDDQLDSIDDVLTQGVLLDLVYDFDPND